jgi:RNase H-like domain found in reverse transcriptase
VSYLGFTLTPNGKGGGLCATLAQRDDQNRTKIISHASRQLKENEKNYTPFLLEVAAAAWGMDNFNEYLKGSRFTLYMDPIMAPNLGNTQMKTLNRLKTSMSDHDFDIKNCQKADLPTFLKQKQMKFQKDHDDNILDFNKTIHVDTFWEEEQEPKAIITITDESTAYSVSAILNDNNINSIMEVLRTQWFDKYGYPTTILFKQGKVQVSKLEEKINKIAQLKTTVTCKSPMTTFNIETKQQWKQNKHQLSGDDFVNTNFFHDFRKLELDKKWDKVTSRNSDVDNEDSSQENEDETEGDFKEVYHLTNNHLTSYSRTKTIRIFWHKLQRKTGCNHRSKGN